MLPFVRQARHLGRYRQIAQVLSRHGFGYLVEQFGLAPVLSLPRRLLLRPPADRLSGPEHLRLALTELGPTFVKLGQVLSTRPDLLPPEFIVELNKLQDTVPSFPGAVAIATIENELGRPIDALFSEFATEPIAAASLGQVHAAVLPNGAQVAVKVQRPDIQRVIAQDLAIIAEFAALAQERSPLGEQYDLVELAWEFDTTIRNELDYRREARNAERFRKHFADSPIVYIPTIYWECCSGRVLTSERLFGVKINDVAGLEAANLDRRRVAAHSTELILREVFKDGFFHADPHPGNFFVLPGEVIGAVDFGQIVSLDRTMTDQLLLLLIGLSRHDTDGTLDALRRLSVIAPRDLTPALRRDMNRFLGNFVDRPLHEISAREMIDDLLALVRRHRLRISAPLAQLFKAIVMMEGTGLLLDPHLDIFVIARPYVAQSVAALNSPEVIAQRAADQVREFGTAAGALPIQFGAVLRQLADGDLQVQVRDLESRRVAAAITLAGLRVSLAVVLLAATLGVGFVLLAVALGWTGLLPLALALAGAVVLLTAGAALVITVLVRRRD
jgi:ubiquinone biosynthesis protein